MLLLRPCIRSEKTRASRRNVFVDTSFIEALLRVPPTDVNFDMDGGTVLNLNNVRNRVLVSTCKRAKIPQVS